MGLYNILELSMNGYPVYKHEFYKMYAIWHQERYIFSTELDDFMAGLGVELEVHDDKDIWVWNVEQKEYVYEPSFSISAYDVLPEIDTFNENIPCKLQISSKGKLAQYFPDQLGIYKLIENVTVYNNPIWKHLAKDFYLRVDEGGFWIVSTVSIFFTHFLLTSFPFHIFSARIRAIMHSSVGELTMGLLCS